MPTALMAGAYEAPACRSPVLPSTGLAAGVAGRITLARLPTSRTNAGPLPAVPSLLGAQAGATAVQATQGRPLAAATAAPLPVAATVVRATATDPSRVATDRATVQVPEGAVTGLVPVLPGRRRRAPSPLPFLARQEEGQALLIGRHVVAPTPLLGRQGPTLGQSETQGLVVVPGRPSVVRRQVGPPVPAPVKVQPVTGPAGTATEVGIRAAPAGAMARLAAVLRLVQALGPAPTPAATTRSPTTRGAAALPAQRRAAVGRKGAITLVPTALLLLVARVVVVRLRALRLEVVPTPIGRVARLGPEGPARALATSVVRRTEEARAAVTGPWRTVGRLAPVEAVATVAVTGALAIPIPVPVPFVLVVGPAEAGEGPPLAGVLVPTPPRAAAAILRSAPRALGVGPTQVPDEVSEEVPALVPVPEAPVGVVPPPTSLPPALPRAPAAIAAALLPAALRQVAQGPLPVPVDAGPPSCPVLAPSAASTAATTVATATAPTTASAVVPTTVHHYLGLLALVGWGLLGLHCLSRRLRWGPLPCDGLRL